MQDSRKLCPASPHSLRRARVFVWLGLSFLLVHTLYFALGVRFDHRMVFTAWQYLDPQALRDDLLRSLFFQHGQPPGFNLFLGITLKLFPQSYPQVLCAAFSSAGFVLYLVTYALMRTLSVSHKLAFLLSTIFIVSPSFILYEQCAFYTLPLATLVATMTLCFYQMSLAPEKRWHLPLLLCAFLLCLSRSLYHLLYFVALVAGLLRLFPGQRRRLVVAAALPLTILLLVCAKNYLLFGTFAPSTWMGMSLARISTQNVDMDERRWLVQQNLISPVSLVTPFSKLDAYPSSYVKAADSYPWVPVLHQPQKSSGVTNYNHIAYAQISRDYLADAFFLIRYRPEAYLLGVYHAWITYFAPPIEIPYIFETTRPSVSVVADLYDNFLYVRLPFEIPITRHYVQYPYASLILGLPAILLLACVFSGRSWRAVPSPTNRILLWTIRFMLLQILYVALVGNFLEMGENNRFRFMTDPLYTALAGYVAQRCLNLRRRGACRLKAAALS